VGEGGERGEGVLTGEGRLVVVGKIVMQMPMNSETTRPETIRGRREGEEGRGGEEGGMTGDPAGFM